MEDGLTLCRSLLPRPEIDALAALIDPVFLELVHGKPGDREALVSRLLARGEKFVPTASSFTVGAAISGSAVSELFRSILRSAAGMWITARVGPAVAVDLDQSWVRRQYAPGKYPTLHRPHGWHQDGALGFNFHSNPSEISGEALLPMVTCWVALNSCGIEAPGLELVCHRLSDLIPPADLVDDLIRARFASDLFWKPVLEPGDALLFQGDILHRTHVNSAMAEDRTSLELRFFDAHRLPSRLSRDRFVLLDGLWKNSRP